MQGHNLAPQHGPKMPCMLDDYFYHLDDDMVDVDYYTVAVASMIAMHGPNVAMAKLIFLHSVQPCYVERSIDW